MNDDQYALLERILHMEAQRGMIIRDGNGIEVIVPKYCTGQLHDVYEDDPELRQFYKPMVDYDGRDD